MTLTYEGKRIEGRSLKDLKRIVRLGEGLHQEFKFKAKHPDKIIREIVAFANTKGGLLIIGVDDDGRIEGVRFPDEEEFVMVKEIETEIEPKIEYGIERIKLPDENEVLIFHIYESHDKPIKAGIGNDKKVYVRQEDKTIQSSREVREILKGKKKDKSLRLNYSDKESVLMNYLSKNPHITLEKFCEIANISRKQASRTLVLMVLTNILNYEVREASDIFFPV